jgi:magnesium transporter
MQAQGYRITEDNRLETLPPKDVIAAWQSGGGAYWLDVVASGEEVLDQWLSGVELNEFIIRVCRDRSEVPRVVPIHKAVFFRIPTLSGADQSTSSYLSALCLPELLVTFHERPLERLNELASGLEAAPVLDISSISELVCVMLIQQTSTALQESLRLRDRVDHLASVMDTDADAVELEQILAEKSALRRLDAFDEGGSYVYNMLSVVNTEALNLAAIKPYYQLVTGNAEFLARNIDRLESRLADVHQRYVVNVQEKTNERLAVLTAVSAIFLPLTLLAGIYGMNFQWMPELKIWYAYPIVLIVMVSIAVGMLTYFKRKGWFE